MGSAVVGGETEMEAMPISHPCNDGVAEGPARCHVGRKIVGNAGKGEKLLL